MQWCRPRLGAALLFQSSGELLETLVGAGLGQDFQRFCTRRQCHWIARQGSGLVDGAFGSELRHDVGAASERGRGQTSAHILPSRSDRA